MLKLKRLLVLSVLLPQMYLYCEAHAEDPFAAILRTARESQSGHGDERRVPSSAVSTSEAISAISSLVSTIATTYIAIQLSRKVIGFLDRVTEGISPHSLAASHVPNLSSILKPNVTLTGNELEIAASIIFPDTIATDFRDLGGLKDIKLSLIDCFQESESTKFNISSSLLKPVRAALLFGPPGCGKTSLVQALCKRLKLPMIPISPSLLFRKYVGETSQLLRATFTLAAKIEPCIIFVDEMDSMFRGRRDSEQEFDRNLKTEFMQLWDSLQHSPSRVYIIGATNRPQDIDPAVQRRFERSFLGEKRILIIHPR